MNISTFFAYHPERMIFVSILFLVFFAVCSGLFWSKGKKIRRLWPALTLGCLWLACGLWEHHCVTMEYNIRVDLMFLLPFAFGLTIGLILCQVILLMPKK